MSGAAPNIIDRFVSYFSPERGMRRIGARRAISVLSENSRFQNAIDALSGDRLRADWVSLTQSADVAVASDLEKARNVVRNLVLNDPYAAGAIRRIAANVIAAGIVPQSRVHEDSRISKDAAEKFNNSAEAVFREWARKKNADVTDRLSFYRIQRICQRKLIEDGEIFLRAVASGNYLGFSFEVIEADRVATPFGSVGKEKKIKYGAELGTGGAPVAYWILKEHPGESFRFDESRFDRVPAYSNNGLPQVIHVYDVLRPGQTRGISPIIPALGKLMNLDRYCESEEMAARVAACFAGFIETPAGGAELLNSMREKDGEGRAEIKLAPAMISALQPGQKITFGDPKRPNSQMGPFTELLLRAIGLAVDLPYELVALDFSKTTYSSARAALLEARKSFRVMQADMVEQVCVPAWELVLSAAVIGGELELPRGFDIKEIAAKSAWLRPGWQWVDPAKEAQAAETGLRNRTTSLARVIGETSETGEDWMDHLKQCKREQDLIEELGLKELAGTSGGPNNGQSSEE